MSATAIPAVSSPRRASRIETAAHLATWPLYTTLFSSLCIVVGLIWDISWHRTVGRDTFWTYPHVLEQVAAIVSGIGCGWLVLHTTFAPGVAAEEARSESVKIWGFRGPLGAWLCIWGTVMMITSAPFDNWWHNAYGLDVTIISPPHMILAAGMVAIQWGALLVALAAHNRAERGSVPGSRLGLPFALGAAIVLSMLITIVLENAGFANQMHSGLFYEITAVIVVFPLLAFARASSLRWPATTIAAIYMSIMLIMIWTLQLFSATPKLAPIYNPVTHMVPPPFPYLLIVPAFVLDVVMRRGNARDTQHAGRGKDWWLSLVLGVTFVAIFLAVQWPFSSFLLSPAARNWFFASDQWDYNVPPGAWQHVFWNRRAPVTVPFTGLAIATGLAIVSARAGLWLGAGMRRIKR